MKTKLLLLSILFLFTVEVSSQITSFVGVNPYVSFNKVRQEESKYTLGFGGGISYIFWEYPEWYLKSGLEYYKRSSTVNIVPDFVEGLMDADPDPVDMQYFQHDIILPVEIYFPLFTRRGNSVLVKGGIDLIATVAEKYQNEEYGTTVLTGPEISRRYKTGLNLGAGYQFKLYKDLYFNIVSSINVDLRATNPFNTIELSAELFYGVY